MASDYPFRRIIGVELLPALHAIAKENLAHCKSESQKCFALESICGDAISFALPEGPLVIYLFNPFSEAGLRHALANLRETLTNHPRDAFVLYHNPQLEHVVADSGFLTKIASTQQYSIFAAQNA
jgi:hypothetical protein